MMSNFIWYLSFSFFSPLPSILTAASFLFDTKHIISQTNLLNVLFCHIDPLFQNNRCITQMISTCLIQFHSDMQYIIFGGKRPNSNRRSISGETRIQKTLVLLIHGSYIDLLYDLTKLSYSSALLSHATPCISSI